ncbi:MAG: cupin domain-containing protein [Spirochaetales bacterium]|nr:cupin domain-containing protein [Spirochaetales bacterium]
MYGFHSEEAYKAVLDGVEIKTLNHGPNMLMTEFRLKKGAVLPEHAHPQEQSGYLVSGSIRLFIDGVVKTMKPGDSWSVGGNIRHKAEILEDSVAIEVFSPVREDYLQYVHDPDLLQR